MEWSHLSLVAMRALSATHQNNNRALFRSETVRIVTFAGPGGERVGRYWQVHVAYVDKGFPLQLVVSHRRFNC